MLLAWKFHSLEMQQVEPIKLVNSVQYINKTTVQFLQYVLAGLPQKIPCSLGFGYWKQMVIRRWEKYQFCFVSIQKLEKKQ